MTSMIYVFTKYIPKYKKMTKKSPNDYTLVQPTKVHVIVHVLTVRCYVKRNITNIFVCDVIGN